MTSMNATREVKSAGLTLRLKPSTKAALARIADGRTMNDTVARLIERADREGLKL